MIHFEFILTNLQSAALDQKCLIERFDDIRMAFFLLKEGNSGFALNTHWFQLTARAVCIRSLSILFLSDIGVCFGCNMCFFFFG